MSFSNSKGSLEKAVNVEVTSLAGPGPAQNLEEAEGPSATGSGGANVGLREFDIARQSGLQVTPEQSRRIARKIDLFLLPMFCVAQGLSFLDKTALNYGNLYGMQQSLHVSGGQFSWFASAFYLGYLVGNYPDSWLLQHYSAGKVLAITTLIWGIIVITTPACTNFASSMANRFFLGVLEAVVSPGLTLLTSIWYAQSEVPFKYLVWYSFNGWAGIFGGFMAYGVGHITNPSIALWKYIFLILGGMSTVFAAALWFFFPDSPVTAPFFTAEEKVLAVKRVAEGKIGVKNTQFKYYQVKHALLDPKTWMLLVGTLASQIPNGIVTNFSTIIIKGFGFTVLQSTLLDAVSSAVQIASLVLAGWICMRFKNMRVITMTASSIICIIAAAFLTFLPPDRKWGRLISYWFTAFQIGGYTKKTFTTVVVFIGFCTGNIIGPHFIINSEAPTYTTGMKAMLIGYVIKTVCHVALGIYMLRSNIKRDREYGKVTTYEDQLKGEDAGMHDLTELENHYHRYVL